MGRRVAVGSGSRQETGDGRRFRAEALRRKGESFDRITGFTGLKCRERGRLLTEAQRARRRRIFDRIYRIKKYETSGSKL